MCLVSLLLSFSPALILPMFAAPDPLLVAPPVRIVDADVHHNIWDKFDLYTYLTNIKMRAKSSIPENLG